MNGELLDESFIQNLNSTSERLRPGASISNIFVDIASLKPGDVICGSNYDGEPSVRATLVKASKNFIVANVGGITRTFRMLERVPMDRAAAPVVDDLLLR